VQTNRANARSDGARYLRLVIGIGRWAATLFLFIGAIQVLKTGAGELDILDAGGRFTASALSTLGLGWIGAMLTLSGSPAVATALTLRATGAIGEVQAFTMVTGARMGAAFVVLLVAVLFASRRAEGQRMAPISTAVMTLVITATMYVPGALIGLGILGWDSFKGVRLQSPPTFTGFLDAVYDPILSRIESWPPAILFVGGLVLLVVSFKLLDSMVPEFDEKRLSDSVMKRLRSKWPMFFLGIGIVIATLSVSVALTVLIPLVGKGYLKREDLVPYIIGADIGTLVDKLLIAFLVGAGTINPASPVRVILAELVGVTIMGLVIMGFIYIPFRRAIWRFQRQMVRSKPRLAAFTGALFVIPIALIVVGVVTT